MSFIAALFMLLPDHAMEAKDYWDIVLDNYEALCSACMEKKSAREIRRLSESLNELLMHKEGIMNQTQKDRFYSIQNRYRGFITISDNSIAETEEPRVVKVDTVRRYEHIQVTDTVFVKEIIGSIELNQYVHNKDTVYHIIQYQEPVAVRPTEMSVSEQIVAEMPAKEASPVRKTYGVRQSVLILGNLYVGPTLSYGATVGVVNKWGGYVGFHSDLKNISSGYSCTSDGFSGGVRIMTNGSRDYSRFAVTAGVCREVNKWLIVAFGAGYGRSSCFWQDIEGTWMSVSDISVKGAEFEAGVLFHPGLFGVSFGVCTTSFNNIGFKIGLGCLF